MKLLHKTLPQPEYPASLLSAGTVLFDIETTGLSADTSYLYLIGAVYLSHGALVLSQWFCEDFSEEKELLSSFLSFMKDKKELVHFNGSGFDLPYLAKKCRRHHLQGLSDDLKTTDVYKLLLPFRKYTSFPDFKQKTLEAASGFKRTDSFSGGDLIEVYAAYTGKSRLASLTGDFKEADALCRVLLLHNHDDLLGLLSLYRRTRLLDLYAGHLQPAVIKQPDGIVFTFDFPLLPFPLSLTQNQCTLTITENETDLFLPFYQGELKYFFKDYKNYSYLKYEDTAVHNSIAEWVEKEAKEKCRPDTAYQKKTSLFLALPFKKPEQKKILSAEPLFYTNLRSLPAYTEYKDSFVCDRSMIAECFFEFLLPQP